MNRDLLLSTLNHARPFLSTKDFIPILMHFCFDGQTVTAYNDIVGVQIDLRTPLHCAVPGSLLLKMLNTMNTEEIELEQQKSNIQLASGKSKVKLPILPQDDFIFKLPDLAEAVYLKLPKEAIHGLEKCLISVGDDPSKPERAGVTWNVKKGQINIYSTDNKSISRFVYYTPKAESEINAITPQFFCEQLISLVDGSDQDDIDFYISKSYALAHIGRYKIYTRLVRSEDNLDFESVISKYLPDPSRLLVNSIPAEFLPALERSSLLISADDVQAAQVEVSGTLFTIKSNSKLGKAEDHVEFSTYIGEFAFQVNPSLVLRAFKVTSRIAILNNVIVTLGGDGTFTHLISHSNTKR